MSTLHSDGTAPPRIGRCPQCGKRIRLDGTNAWRPFCSERCKLIDLQGWFDGRYQIPGEPHSAPHYDDNDQ